MSTSLVIFGASGDLTVRKLVPALYSLHAKGRLPQDVTIIGNSRSHYTHDEFRAKMEKGTREHAKAPFDEAKWAAFAPRIFYVSADATKPDGMATLKAFLDEHENDAHENDDANRLYYLSVAPSLYETIVANLGNADMVQRGEPWRRIVIEKPFGTDLASAHALNEAVHEVFEEEQIYRIDHYLGKETAQNILFFRFANVMFEPIWNRTYIDNIQITVAETVDVDQRAAFYDQTGILRDMFQNHLLQLLTLVAMEPPTSFDATPMRNEKVKVLNAIRPVKLSDTVRGQYRGYREIKGVDPDSQTATYAALKFYVDNWRWQGVPFYVRSGKALKEKATEIIVTFKRPPHLMFTGLGCENIQPNTLSLCIQPDEGIHLQFEAKVPDTSQETQSTDMEFHYGNMTNGQPMPEAYERLLLDALLGDAALFTRSDEIEAAWRIIDPVIDGWHTTKALPMVTYDRGTWGPSEANDFMETDGRAWHVGGCRHE